MKITVPTSWKDVSLSKFQEIALLSPDLSQHETILNAVCIYCDLDITVARKWPTDSVMTIAANISWTRDLPADVLVRSFFVDEVEYEIIEDLDSLRYDEVMLIMQCLAEPVKNMHGFLALMYRPVGKKFDSERFVRRSKLFREKLSVEPFFGALTHFRDHWKKLSKIFFSAPEEVEENEPNVPDPWSWYRLLYSISDGDFVKMDRISEMNFVSVMEFNMFEKENMKLVDMKRLRYTLNYSHIKR